MTTSTRPTTTSRNRVLAAGPAADLAGLPDVTGVTPTVPAEVDTHLSRIETARARQLDAVPSVNLDTVTAAYRAAVERILDEVRAARDRVAAGVYGVCTRCDNEIPAQRLELRPWVATCEPCARREHH